MRSGNRNLTFWLLCAAVLTLPSLPAAAQNVPKPPAGDPAAKKDPNVALKALETGSKAYSAGKFEPAVQSLTAALSNGGLPPPKMAQAYYYRGMAYKKQKKPAQALSDLTVAVWVNGGLNEADRAAAMDARNEVYREAGLGDQAPPIANAVGTPLPKAAGASPAQAAAPAPAAAPSPPPAVAKAAPPAPSPNSFATAVAPAPQAPAAPQVAATPPAPASRPVWQADPDSTPPLPMPMPVAETAPAGAPVATLSQQTNAPPAPVMAPSTALAPAPDDAAAQPASSTPDMMAPLASAGSSISGFFSNMFGQGGQKQAEASPPQATGSTAGGGDGLGWAAGAGTPQGPAAQVSASEPQRAPGYEVAAAPPHASATAKAVVTSAGGKYRLQLASVRSREEADRLAQTVMSSHGQDLNGAAAEVDETVIGNMGTFYRVRLGPYANASEPKKLCNTLKPQGYDCQVVTQ